MGEPKFAEDVLGLLFDESNLPCVDYNFEKYGCQAINTK